MITFATCFYKVTSKFDVKQYQLWMNHLLHNVRHFNLVVYTNRESRSFIHVPDNPRIHVVLKEFEEFQMYAYKENWIQNQQNNTLLQYVDWKLLMIWAEKVHFVDDASTRISSDWYGWMDIGYFRGRDMDISPKLIQTWAKPTCIERLDSNFIYYANVNTNEEEYSKLCIQIQDRNEVGLPRVPISPYQMSIAGGFFILHVQSLVWWKKTFTAKVQLYFQHNYLIKDDQMIIIDCYVDNPERFKLIQENNPRYDKWFMFQRFLLT